MNESDDENDSHKQIHNLIDKILDERIDSPDIKKRKIDDNHKVMFV